MRAKPQTFVELFCGAGLLGGAFVQAGFKPLLAVDLSQDAIDTYRQNLGDHAICGDVESVSTPGKCDVLIAGPPCQGFSTLNRSRADDPRNQLALSVVRWVRECTPKLVVIENVEPFLQSPVASQLSAHLAELGYQVDARVLNAHDYGTAQVRKRSILVGQQARGVFQFPTLSASRRTVADAWKNLPSTKSDKLSREYPKPSELALERFRVTPEGGDRRDVMAALPASCPKSWFRLRENDNTGVWGRMWRNRPSPTVRTAFQNPSKGRYIHPTEDRVISLREAARLQDIPDNWQFSGTRTAIARQIGNGVPLRMGAVIALACKQAIAA